MTFTHLEFIYESIASDKSTGEKRVRSIGDY